MIIKQISFENFNQAIIKGYRNGLYLVVLQEIAEGEVINETQTLLYPELTVLGISLNQGESQLVKGYSPVVAWNMTETKTWLTQNGIEFTDSMTEAELLALCPNPQYEPDFLTPSWSFKKYPKRVTVPLYSVLEGERYAALANNMLKMDVRKEYMGANVRIYLAYINAEDQAVLEADPEVTIEEL